ncbi:hypothetical protein [Sphingomonas sp.]|uniref:hypothetical protein n=1 Tax=Sphingomonas sp. TaxID=28214 RepID=UPI002C22BF6F|nr:hypothetical protein [Sphingomonas sp.]HTG39049.1 hypothetical protein [Sphingomonas sp.]
MLPFYLAHAGDLRDAEHLMLELGEAAAGEARSRADHSRTLGNIAAFCRWRQIDRAIKFLREAETPPIVH